VQKNDVNISGFTLSHGMYFARRIEEGWHPLYTSCWRHLHVGRSSGCPAQANLGGDHQNAHSSSYNSRIVVYLYHADSIAAALKAAVEDMFMWADLWAALPKPAWEVMITIAKSHSVAESAAIMCLFYAVQSAASGADLRRMLCGVCVQEEERLWDDFVKAGVLMTPGEFSCQHCGTVKAHSLARDCPQYDPQHDWFLKQYRLLGSVMCCTSHAFSSFRS